MMKIYLSAHENHLMFLLRAFMEEILKQEAASLLCLLRPHPHHENSFNFASRSQCSKEKFKKKYLFNCVLFL